MKCRGKRDTTQNIPRCISFSRCISCYIAENWLTLGQCMQLVKTFLAVRGPVYSRMYATTKFCRPSSQVFFSHMLVATLPPSPLLRDSERQRRPRGVGGGGSCESDTVVIPPNSRFWKNGVFLFSISLFVFGIIIAVLASLSFFVLFLLSSSGLCLKKFNPVPTEFCVIFEVL